MSRAVGLVDSHCITVSTRSLQSSINALSASTACAAASDSKPVVAPGAGLALPVPTDTTSS